MSTIITLGKYIAVQITTACPEEWDIRLDDVAVAHLRLSHGKLALRMAHDNSLVYTRTPIGSVGQFVSTQQRLDFLYEAVFAIDKVLNACAAWTPPQTRRCDKPTFHDSEPHTGFVWYWDSELRSWMLVEYQKIDHGDIWLPYKDLPDPEG